MIERGSNKHSPKVDDELKDEIEPVMRSGRPSRAEDWREPEPFPDDTDDPEVQAAVYGAPIAPAGTDEDSAPDETAGQ
ncbi:MAG: hypothetical protein JWN05_2717 [Arthrobacter sp.]|jgi:hypothetical protein|nr:hypothetical protein [Arthrobacter sp.]